MDRAQPLSLLPACTPPVLGPAWAGGLFLAEVVDLKDPDSLARVQVRLHATAGVADQDGPVWASVVSGFAGDQRGAFWMPDVGDLVVVGFAQGDARMALVLGGVWHGGASAPETMDGAGNNYLKVIRSRNGVTITLDDQDGQESITLETPGGQSLKLSDGPGVCLLEDANGNSIKLESSGITVTASAKITVNASQVNVSAGMVKVDAGMSKFSGVVKCDTLIASAVVSSSYTPGAGNVW